MSSEKYIGFDLSPSYNHIFNLHKGVFKMYYNLILKVWVTDQIDYFLLSALLGSVLSSSLKDYLSEKKAMERLKNSIIEKSKANIQSDISTLNSKEIKIKKIYKFALQNRGGQFEDFQAGYEVSKEVLTLAQKIKVLVEGLASFLKERELKGVAKIFFKNGALLLELVLYNCNIGISYKVLTEELSIQVIVITFTTGGVLGFVSSWLSVGARLLGSPLYISMLLKRSILKQIANQRDYANFKKMVDKVLEDDELKQTLRAVFMEGEIPTTSTAIKMKPWDSDKNSLLEFNFESRQSFQEFIEARMKEELGLVPNSTPEQLEKIISNKRIKSKRKIVYFKDFIEEIAEDPYDIIIDAEITKKL